MRQGRARVGGGFAIALSILLAFWIVLSSVRINALNAWTIILCGSAE